MRSVRQHLCHLCGPCMHVSGVAAQDLLIRSAADAAVLSWNLACQLHTGRHICPCRQLADQAACCAPLRQHMRGTYNLEKDDYSAHKTELLEVWQLDIASRLQSIVYNLLVGFAMLCMESVPYSNISSYREQCLLPNKTVGSSKQASQQYASSILNQSTSL